MTHPLDLHAATRFTGALLALAVTLTTIFGVTHLAGRGTADVQLAQHYPASTIQTVVRDGHTRLA